MSTIRFGQGAAKWFSIFIAGMCALHHEYDAATYFSLAAMFWQWEAADYDGKHGGDQ